MRAIGFLLLIMALSAPAWSTCQAAGSFQTKPMFPEAKAGVPSVPLGRPPESVFDFVQGITALARGKAHQDARLELEGKAKRLLEQAA